MKMFVIFVILVTIVKVIVAGGDLQEQYHIDPITEDQQEHPSKEQDKRTIFSNNRGWAKHVGIHPAGFKYVIGYGPVDYKYVPVLRPLSIRPHGHHHHIHRPKLHIKHPVIIKPLLPVRPVIHQDGWKPVVPVKVPVLPHYHYKPWISAKPVHVPVFKPVVSVDHVHVKPVAPVDHVHVKPVVQVEQVHQVIKPVITVAKPIVPVHVPVRPVVPFVPSKPLVPVAPLVPIAPAVVPPPLVPHIPQPLVPQLPHHHHLVQINPVPPHHHHVVPENVPIPHHHHHHVVPASPGVVPHVIPAQPPPQLLIPQHNYAVLEPLVPHHHHLLPSHPVQEPVVPHHHHHLLSAAPPQPPSQLHPQQPHEQHDVQTPVLPQNHPIFQQQLPQNFVYQQLPQDQPLPENVYNQQLPQTGPTVFNQHLDGNVQHLFNQQIQHGEGATSTILLQGSSIQPGQTDLQIPAHLPQHPTYLPEGGRQFQPGNFHDPSQHPDVVRPSFGLEPPFTNK